MEGLKRLQKGGSVRRVKVPGQRDLNAFLLQGSKWDPQLGPKLKLIRAHAATLGDSLLSLKRLAF